MGDLLIGIGLGVLSAWLVLVIALLLVRPKGGLAAERSGPGKTRRPSLSRRTSADPRVTRMGTLTAAQLRS